METFLAYKEVRVPTATCTASVKRMSKFLFFQSEVDRKHITPPEFLGEMFSEMPELKLAEGEEKRFVVTLTVEPLGS